jgi:YD repeat-containing protein
LLDARGNTVSARSNDPAQSYDVVRDARGRTTSINSKAGRTVKLEYDAGGNETVIAYSDAGRVERSFDAAGHKVSERLPGGLVTHYKYDARGNVSEQSNDNGRSLQVERDASGAITGLVSGGGSFIRAERDATGRIVALTNSSGKTRRFAYDARGSLVSYTDARGKRSAFGYDRRGRLRNVADSEGVSLRLDYDRAGHLAAVRRAAPAKDAAQFLRASLSSFMPPAGALRQDEFCLFGGGDGWFEGDTFYSDFGMDCMDPFGGLGDPFGDPTGWGFSDPNDPNWRGDCYDCQKRELDICRLQLNAELRTVLAGSLGITLTCLAWVAVPWRYYSCLVGALTANGLLNDAARDKAEACKLTMRRTCETACPNIIWP